MNDAFGKQLCLDNLQRNEDQPYNLGQYPCHAQMAMSQVSNIYLSEIRLDLIHFSFNRFSL